MAIDRVRSILGSICVSLLACIPSVGEADELSDWRDTAEEIRKPENARDPGCRSLRWVGGQSDCDSANVKEYCKESALTYRGSPATCKSMRDAADNLVKKRREEMIEGLKKTIDNEKNEGDASKKRDYQEKIQKIRDALRNNDQEIENLYRALTDGRKVREACAAARHTVAKVFLAAAEKADRVTNDSPVKKEARESAIIWKYSHTAHMEERVNVRLSVENCSEGLDIVGRRSSY